jgi:hypothetical protein
MRDIDLDEAFGTLVRQLPHRRYRHAVAMIARQVALREAGASWQEYFEENRHRLLTDAASVIATHQAWAKYRRR